MQRAINKDHVLNPNYVGLQENGVLAVICEWVDQNAANGRIQNAHDLAAGWEVWAQVELAVYINQRLGGRYATRKAGAYQAQLYADVIVCDDHEAPVHVIELKCRVPDSSDATFKAELDNDRFKLTENALQISFKNARKWAIGINVGTVLNNLNGNWNRVGAGGTQVYHRSFV